MKQFCSQVGIEQSRSCNYNEGTMKASTGWVTLAIVTLAVVSPTLTVQAQASIDHLALEQRVDITSVSPGDRLTFTLILTNTGSQPVTGLIVSDTTPKGTVFFGASGPRSWLITTPAQDQSGDAVWRNTAALQPNERVELQLLVTVQAVDQILSPGFAVKSDQLAQSLTSPSIRITVQPKTSEAVVGLSIGWLAIIFVLFVLIIGAWRWRTIKH